MNRDRPHVLFLNTRTLLGADVAVHVTLMRALDADRCQVTLATNRCSPDLGRLLAEVEGVRGLRIVQMNLGYEMAGARGLARIGAALGNLAAMGVSLVRLAWLVLRTGVDIIHTTDRPRDALLGVLLARLTGRKSLVHLHIKWERGLGRATRWGIARADAVLAISQFVRRSLIEGGVAEDKVHTALNAIEVDRYDPDRVERGVFRRSLNLSDDEPLIGIVARVMFWKGHLDLVRALPRIARRFPSVRLAIVGRATEQGPGSFAGQIADLAQELGVADNLIWAGWRDDAAHVFADLDVLCVPSFEEPFGLVVIEGMAMRRAVVAYSSGALPEIVTAGVDGLLVAPQDVDGLADALVQALDDAELRRRLGEAGRQTVLARFAATRQADEVLAIYRRVCGMATE
jgi:glycosyltransferase involved in cell wall biosynthesis